MAAIWGWDEDWQAQRFQDKFDASRWQIIIVDGQEAGGVSVRRHTGAISLDYFYIWPEFQKHLLRVCL